MNHGGNKMNQGSKRYHIVKLMSEFAIYDDVSRNLNLFSKSRKELEKECKKLNKRNKI